MLRRTTQLVLAVVMTATAAVGRTLATAAPDHNDHTHVDGRTSRSWSAPKCGV